MAKSRKPAWMFHECAGKNCTRRIDTKWKFCRKCSGLTKRGRLGSPSRRGGSDAMDHLLPGHFNG